MSVSLVVCSGDAGIPPLVLCDTDGGFAPWRFLLKMPYVTSAAVCTWPDLHFQLRYTVLGGPIISKHIA